MAELTISAADIASALKKNLEGFEPSVEARTVGRSNYTLRKLITYFGVILFTFTVLPLRVLAVTGSLLSVTGLGVGVYYLIRKLTGHVTMRPMWFGRSAASAVQSRCEPLLKSPPTITGMSGVSTR